MENREIKILAIDDNKDNLISLKALIKEAFPDATFLTALNGEKGLELTVSEDPDVILLDIVMPGMDGFEVCKNLKANKKLSDIPVVFVTALNRDKENRIRALECGAEAFLTKPIDESELTAQIRAMVKIRAANLEKRNENERLAVLVSDRTRELELELAIRKQTEGELLKAKDRAEESDRLKSAFLANMSHEIRTPMNGILGFARLLKEPMLTGEQQQQYIQIIEKSGARMLNIINNIVDISKIESGQMDVSISETNINEQIEFIYTFFKQEVKQKGMQLSFKTPLPSNDANIKTDREKIYAILTNLVKNAIKYTNQGSIEFGYEKKSKYLEFFVKDTGIGIAGNRQYAIFDRFVQADIADKKALQGAGLGLSIAKAYVEMLGGKIWVESEEGMGSSFYFTIPYENEPEEMAIPQDLLPAENKETLFRKLKILIADDEESSDFLMTVLLNKIAHTILHAKTGVEAIETCRKNPDIDVIMMDIKMPEMNGYEATREIRKFNQDVIIIAQTAFALKGDKESALETGCNDHITKPIQQNELLKLIYEYF